MEGTFQRVVGGRGDWGDEGVGWGCVESSGANGKV